MNHKNGVLIATYSIDGGGGLLTLFRLGGGHNVPPLSRICVYACGYAHRCANFFLLFLIFSVEEMTALSTQ